MSDKETAPWIKEREGWMCSVDFDYEVGNASDGNVVYPSKENLRENRSCIDADEYCRAKRVYVIDADRADTLFAEECTAQAPTQLLIAALKRIQDGGTCECEHDSPDCCNNCDPIDFVCPECIAGVALKQFGATPQSTPTESDYQRGFEHAVRNIVATLEKNVAIELNPDRKLGLKVALGAAKSYFGFMGGATPQGTPPPQLEELVKEKRNESRRHLRPNSSCLGILDNRTLALSSCGATPQGTPGLDNLVPCEHCHHIHIGNSALYDCRKGTSEQAPPTECPQCGSNQYWTALPACHGGKAHKWHSKGK